MEACKKFHNHETFPVTSIADVVIVHQGDYDKFLGRHITRSEIRILLRESVPYTESHRER